MDHPWILSRRQLLKTMAVGGAVAAADLAWWEEPLLRPRRAWGAAPVRFQFSVPEPKRTALVESLAQRFNQAQKDFEVKVEFVEAKQQTIPITLHHVHFFNPKNTEMQAWYVKTFGAKPRSGGAFPAADLPGVALNFSPSTDPVVGTQGRALDHIGFEVKDLEAFCRQLEADGVKLAVPYRKVPALGIAIAFITDPWGTYIEMTEGLDKVG